MAKAEKIPAVDKSIRVGAIVSRENFPEWIKQNLDLWTQYPFDKSDDPVMLQQIATVFENPQQFSPEVIYRLTLRGGRLIERTTTPGKTPQKMYEMYQRGLHAMEQCSAKDQILTDSLQMLLHDQDFFDRKQPLFALNAKDQPSASFSVREEINKAEAVLHHPETISPEEIFTTTLDYAALQVRNASFENIPIRLLHAFRKGLNALAGCAIKEAVYIHELTKLFSQQSILVQQMVLVPEGPVNKNAYQQRVNKIGQYEKPPKPKIIPINAFEDYTSKKDDRVTVAVFQKPSGKENEPIGLTDKILLLQRHPNPSPETHPEGWEDWYAYDWEMVGGGITTLPDQETTARAEVQQETSLNDFVLTPYGVIPAEVDPRGRQNWIYHTVISDDVAIVTSREHIQYRWVTVHEALSRPLARDHEAIFRKLCHAKGNEEVKRYIESFT